MSPVHYPSVRDFSYKLISCAVINYRAYNPAALFTESFTKLLKFRKAHLTHVPGTFEVPGTYNEVEGPKVAAKFTHGLYLGHK